MVARRTGTGRNNAKRLLAVMVVPDGERHELPRKAETSGASPTASNRRSSYLIKPNTETAPVPDAIHTLHGNTN